MEVHNIITIEKQTEGYHLENVESFVALDVGIDQAKVYQNACEAFISKIEEETDTDIPYKIELKFIEVGVYENDEVIIYFKTSEDAS